MANYNDLSRRGLIKLNKDYDQSSNDSLKKFLDGAETAYEEIRPYEEVVERLDQVTEALQDKSSIVTENIMKRVNSVFDVMVAAIADEADRCESVLDEQEDDETYPDEAEDGEE